MREIIYKGATRPSMKWGVPLIVLVGAFLPMIILSIWTMMGLIFSVGRIGLLVVPIAACVIGTAFMWMRRMTVRDDQRLDQVFTSFKLRMRNRNRALFKNRSYGAYRAQGAVDVWRR